MQPVSPRVVDLLNDALSFELTVTNTYFLHARMLDNWGLSRLGKVFYDLSIDEMRDADSLINRILMFDGHPNVQRLNAIRHENPALQYLSNVFWLDAQNDQLFAYVRRLGDVRLLVVVNLSGARSAGWVQVTATLIKIVPLIAVVLLVAVRVGSGTPAERLKVGDGTVEGTQMGPLANPRRVSAMAELHQDAVSKGAQVLAGGKRIGDSGNFWEPTVLVDVPLEARMFNDEPFGPVAGIRSFNKLEEAIAEANRLSFGLAGYAFTKSLKNADLLARRVEVGMLWINMPAMPSAEMPFGGIKDSGYGSEGGPESLEAYLNVRSVAVMNV